MQQEANEQRNLMMALLIGMAIMISWHFLYEMPRQQEQAAAKKAEQERQATLPKDSVAAPVPSVSGASSALAEAPAAAANSADAAIADVATPLPRQEALREAPRITIHSNALHGSLSLKGARLDDLTLAAYHETIAKDSPEVTLLSPARTAQPYFMETGWLRLSGAVTVPDTNTLWQSADDRLTPEHPVTLYWDSPEGIRFELHIAMDEHFLFTVTQRVINHSSAAVSLAPYGLVNRAYTDPETSYYILHEGPLGLKEDALFEVDYSDLREEGPQTVENTTGWAGITDKYWLTAIAPAQGTFKTTYQYYAQQGQNRYQTDLLGASFSLTPGAQTESTTRLFAGAKLVWLLDKYSEQYNIPLFDRTVDFGTLYFLTKPIFLMLDYFYSLLGNFGLAILLLTVVIKLILFPLANKSYASMAQMKALMPKMEEIRATHKGDSVKLNQEIIALYKREGVNPASGCLPMLIQLPVFFSLYKVLFVTIEMRHAPFFGWVKDLSAIDPTNVFNLFGLIAWDPPSFMHIGALPLLLTATMIVQQRLTPKPADPAQAMVLQYLPYVFLFIFANFPAGLVIYWTWNNLLSILQQWVISRNAKNAPSKPKRRKAAAASEEA